MDGQKVDSTLMVSRSLSVAEGIDFAAPRNDIGEYQINSVYRDITAKW